MKNVLLAIAFGATLSFAATWHVPDDSPTIQDALNSLSTGDSIVVSPGLYIEALRAPDHLSFVMIGIFDTTKQNDLWVIVDPSWLDSSNHKACMTIPSHATATIRNIVFRNSWPMFPRLNGATGGIINNSPNLTVGNCRFDSTFGSLAINSGELNVEDCEFRNERSGFAILKNNSVPVTIRNSLFTGRYFESLFTSGNAVVENCIFFLETSEWFWIQGPNITIRGCTFTGDSTQTHAVIWTAGTTDMIIENNVFHDFQMMNDGTCLSLLSTAHGLIEICGNQFSNIIGGSASARGLDANGNADLVICDNSFENCVGGQARAISIFQMNANIINNTFRGHSNSVPYIWATRTLSDTIHINDQSFAGTGWALAVDGANIVDAENNWWGDSTGPYHVTRNPNGVGATITGAADFDPWLLSDPDSSHNDSGEVAPEPPSPLPLAVQLAVYPNPFNATATLKLDVNQPGSFNVDLFNLLGEHVEQIWSGAIAYEKTIALDGQPLSSGIYFIRVWQPIGNRPLALQKIVLLKYCYFSEK